MVEKKLRKYIIPNMLAMMGISCYVLADTYFISAASGADGITALNLALPIYGLMFAIGSMIGIGSATRYSLSISFQKEDTDTYFFNSLFWTFLVSVIFVLFGIFSPELVLKAMGADQTILQIGRVYMRIILCFAPAFMLNYTFTSFVRNDQAPRIAMIATLSSSFFNIVFDYVFMFPMKMGMPGAALATGLAPILSIVICMLHFLSKKNTIRLRIQKPRISKLFSACALGIAGFVGEMSNAVTSLAFNYILLGLAGNIAVAAYGIVANISLVGIAVFNGISQGLQPLASQAEGQRDTEGKKRILKASVKTGIGVAILLIFICFAFTAPIVGVFNSAGSKVMADYAVTGLKLYSTGFLLAGVNIIRSGYLSAVGRAKECSVISLSRGIVAIIFFAFVLSRFLGVTGVWLAFPATEIFTFFLSREIHWMNVILKKKQGKGEFHEKN